MAKGEKPGIVIYWDIFDMLERTKGDQTKRLLKAIRNFGQYGEIPNFEDDDGLNFVWPTIEQKIIADGERYEEIKQKRAEAGRKGGQARANKLKQKQANEANASFDKQIKPNTKTETNTDTDTKTYTNTESVKAVKPPRTRFIPPSVEEVRTYCMERGNSVDPKRFVDYYTSNGWMAGRNKMRDWKAAVRTWENNGFNTKRTEVSNGRTEEDRNAGYTWDLSKESVY